MSHYRLILSSFALSLMLANTANAFQLFHPKEVKKEDTSVAKNQPYVPMILKNELSAEAIKALLEIKFPGMNIDSVEPSPKEGIYQAFYNGQLLYVSSDGDFMFTGNLLGLTESEPVNHTEIAMKAKAAELSPQRAKVIAGIKEDDMVIKCSRCSSSM